MTDRSPLSAARNRFGELDDAIVARVEAASRDEREHRAERERIVTGAPDTPQDVLA